jgi:hypothetical protein
LNWTTVSRRRTVAFVLVCGVGLWMLTRGRDAAPIADDQALRGEAERNRHQERHTSPAVELVSALDDDLPARTAASVESPEADEPVSVVESTQQAAPPVDDRVYPVYSFWDDSGGPPMLDDELTLTLVERADGGAFKPWSNSVELSAVRDMQPKFTVALPLPAPGLYRATCRDGRYKPTDVWVPDIDHPQVAIVLEPADSAGSGR